MGLATAGKYSPTTHTRTICVPKPHNELQYKGKSYWESVTALTSGELSMSLDMPLTP